MNGFFSLTNSVLQLRRNTYIPSFNYIHYLVRSISSVQLDIGIYNSENCFFRFLQGRIDEDMQKFSEFTSLISLKEILTLAYIIEQKFPLGNKAAVINS